MLECPTASKPTIPGGSTTIPGGFLLIPARQLLDTWHACRARPLGPADFRAYLACREILGRRANAGQGRGPRFDHLELAGLLGVSPRAARASVGRLTRAGLIRWSADAIAFPGPPADGPAPSPAIDAIGGGLGKIAIPRRLLRYLAKGASPAVLATAISALFRCLSRRKAGFDGRGRFKASWVARAFGLDIRSVKAARRRLIDLGWLAPEVSGQLSENRWGRAYRIDLGWAPPTPPPDVADHHPSPPSGCRRSPPPLPNQEPFQEGARNQEPAPGGPAGVEARRLGRGTPGSTTTPAGPDPATRGGATIPGPAPAPLPAPKLADVRPEDLKDTGRLLELHKQAAARGLVNGSEADRLRVVAAAEHALEVGKGNPPGLFAHLVRNRLWRYLTQGDEDRANTRLKRELRGELASRPGPVAEPPRVAEGPSDGEVVRAIRAATIRAGIYRDPFEAFAKLNPGWTRERWDRALEEGSGSGSGRARRPAPAGASRWTPRAIGAGPILGSFAPRGSGGSGVG